MAIPRIRQQVSARVPHQAHSTGAVEAVNRWLKQTLGQRARHLGNRQRTIKLLDLLTLGYNHHADRRDGRPQLAQRQLDDLKSTASLYA